MQIATILGTSTALPANAWLIRKGWKGENAAAGPPRS
jgi:hypothetical protein